MSHWIKGYLIWLDLYQNEWLWPLFRGRLRSRQPLRHIRHRISRKQRLISKGPSIGYVLWDIISHRTYLIGGPDIKWSRERWRNLTLHCQTRDPNMLRSQYLENGWRWRLRSKEPPIGNGIWGIKCLRSRDQRCHMAPKGRAFLSRICHCTNEGRRCDDRRGGVWGAPAN